MNDIHDFKEANNFTETTANLEEINNKKKSKATQVLGAVNRRASVLWSRLVSRYGPVCLCACPGVGVCSTAQFGRGQRFMSGENLSDEA